MNYTDPGYYSIYRIFNENSFDDFAVVDIEKFMKWLPEYVKSKDFMFLSRKKLNILHLSVQYDNGVALVPKFSKDAYRK